MGILNLKPTWEVPADSSCVIEATDKGIYMYAGVKDASESNFFEFDDKHAYETVAWQDLYTHDDKAREVFLQQKWFQLLATARSN